MFAKTGYFKSQLTTLLALEKRQKCDRTDGHEMPSVNLFEALHSSRDYCVHLRCPIFSA